MNSRPHTPVHQDFAASTDTSSTTLVNPTSTILQDLIKEQRATRSARKTPQLSEDVDNRPTTAGSQPLTAENSPSEKQRRINSFASSGQKQPRDMGIREMDQYVSKMNKLNFDLKLEIFHRKEQIAGLEKRMERMHEMEEELKRMHDLEDELDELREVEENNQRLREENEQLQSELDRRDQAISEAVELICHLEAKVEELQTGRGTTPLPKDGGFNAVADVSEVRTPRAQTFVDIPDRTSSRKGTVRRPRKSPSFLREENRSTAALRSLFLQEENKSVRSVSASTRGTTVDSIADPPSPRLSILSECSYFAPHDPEPKGTGFDHLDRLDQMTLVNNEHSAVAATPTKDLHNGHLSDRISDWMYFDQRSSQRKTSNGNRYRARAVSDVSRGSHVPITHLDEPFQPMRKTGRTQQLSPRQQHLAEFGGNLPPTPDTMSTFRPAFKNGSNVSLPMDKLTRSVLSRPRSADELTTRSISMSTRSDGIDTAASVVSQLNAQNSPTNLYSFNHYGRGSAKATCVLGPGSPSSPRISCYGGDLLFNGEGAENVVRTSSSESITPALTPQEWLEAAKAEDETSKVEHPSPELEAEEKLHEEFGKDDSADEITIEDAHTPRNPPLRLHAWATESQPMPEVQQHRRRLSLRPRFLTRNRQSQDTQPESVVTSNTILSPIPHRNLLIRHRRTSSGPGLNSDEGASPVGRTSGRTLTTPLSDRRPSTASRLITSDSPEPRSKGSLLLGWMKGSHNKDTESSPTGHLGFARSTTERPKSTASIDVSSLNLARGGELATPDDEPAWRARRRSRRMV
ncbi:conserved hypothetical protein [Talaromyces marneffei ATCC 18224]|uniref:Uncharacterized protein n=2 Tax=Talaromyces marneffei TaxID=37727 RepID=B6QQA8_TALMQ|nr:conserved hypothetical protein [Talaromyces marneffei ATCC 18224]